MTTYYVLRAGSLTMGKLQVENAITEIHSAGDLNLVTQSAKMTARAKLRGIAGLSTVLLGRLFTLDGEGPFSDIKWHLRYGLGLEDSARGVENAGRIGLGVTEEATMGVGKAVNGIFSIPGQLLKQEAK